MPVINTPYAAYTGHDNFNLEFTTDVPAVSKVQISYTDKFGIPRTEGSSHSISDDSHKYSFRNLPRDTTITYTITATFPDGTVVIDGPHNIDIKSPKLFANVRTAEVSIGGSEVSLRRLKPKLFENPRFYYVQMTVSANTRVRFEENQDTQLLIPNNVYYFYIVGDIYLTGPSTVNLAFMVNPNF
jgi:hypothetical protein